MKKNIFLFMLPLLAACSGDKKPESGGTSFATANLVTPRISVMQAQSPFSGYLEIYPCTANTSTYYGNYFGTIPQRKSIPPTYVIKSGSIDTNSPSTQILLPVGTYNLIYWGQTIPPDTVISYPQASSPALVLGTDLSRQYYGLRPKSTSDTLYWNTPDFVFATQEVHIGEGSIGTNLQRVVSGINITLTSKDGSEIDPAVTSILVTVGSIAQWLNAATGAPSNMTKTVAIPLKFSPSRYSAYNQVMLFPSGTNPLITVILTLENGDVKTYQSNLTSPLQSNNMRNLSITIGEIYSSSSTGNDFEVGDWNESDESIDL